MKGIIQKFVGFIRFCGLFWEVTSPFPN
jgi:hypothetical protein